MESSNFPLEKTNGHSLQQETERSVPLYGCVESLPSREVATTAGYASFLDYWRILIRQRKMLLLGTLAGLIAAVLIGAVETPIYRARTSLEIQDFNDNFLDLKNVDPTVTKEDYPTGTSYFETQVKLLQSESLLERVIEKLKLPDATKSRSLVRRMLGLAKRPHPLDNEELVRQVENNLIVRPAGNTRVLEVLYESQDPKLAADFANTLVSEFIEESQEMRLKAFQRTAEHLTVKLDQMKAKLEESEQQLQDYARTSGLTFTSEKDNVSDARLVEIQSELTKAQAERIAKEAKFEQAKKTTAESLPEMLDDPTLREYHLRLTELRRQLVELSATLTPVHFKVQRVQAQISELESAVQNQRALILRRIGNEYSAARRREEFLRNAYVEQQMIAADQSSKAIRYGTLKGEVDSSRQLYEGMLDRVKQAELASAMRANNVVVIDPAEVPRRPYKPNLPMNAAVGLFGGFFLTLGVVFFRERLDRRIQFPGEAHIYLNTSELGVITSAEITPSRQIADNGPTNRAMAIRAESSDSPLDDCPELAAWNQESSLSADCYRATVTSILLANQNGNRPRVIVVTSPCQGDGKTTVASNLGIAMAELGRRVLLIDGDLRRPRLDRFFGLSNNRGLSNALRVNTPLGEIGPIKHLFRETEISGLYLLPAGDSTTNTTRLLHSPRMSELLGLLRREFDMVIVDAPPILQQLADARVLGHLADGVILVIRAGQTTIDSALFATERFAKDGTRVLGTILNGWDPKTGGRYGYGGYYAAMGGVSQSGEIAENER
jgi:succinoglycan biosynthesis transport protein ExoP